MSRHAGAAPPVRPRCHYSTPPFVLVTCGFSAYATPSVLTYYLSVTALGLSAQHRPTTIVPAPARLKQVIRPDNTPNVPACLWSSISNHDPDSRAHRDRAGRGDPCEGTVAGRGHRPLSTPHGRAQRPGRRVLHRHRRTGR